MKTLEPNLYELLGVPQNATDRQIAKAYRMKSLALHPDVAGEKVASIYQMLTFAFETLSNPAQRSAYDQKLKGGTSEPQAPTSPTGHSRTPGFTPDAPEQGLRVPFESYSGPLPRTPITAQLTWLNESGEARVVGAGFSVKKKLIFAAVSIPLLLVLVYFAPQTIYVAVWGAVMCLLALAFSRIPKRAIAILIATNLAMALTMIFAMGSGINAFSSGVLGFLDSLWIDDVLLTAAASAYWITLAIWVGRARRRKRVITNKDALEFFTWGDPGAGLHSAVAKFGAQNVAKGIEGEKLTAAELSYFLTPLPGVKLLNGLKFPGSVSADVDHCFIRGHKVAFIDSKAWAPRRYTMQPGGEGILECDARTGAIMSLRESHMAEAVARYEKILKKLNKNIEVRGYIVVHPTHDPQSTTVSNEGASRLHRLVDSNGLISELGEWMKGEENSFVDVRLLSLLLCYLKLD